MNQIIINNCSYNIHPIYSLYAASEDGRIIHIIKHKPNFGNKDKHGYRQIKVRKFGESGQKNYMAQKFIYECYHGVITDGKVIDHRDDNRENNRLCNLQLLTPSENTKKSIKNRTTFNTHKNRKSVKSTNKKTNEVSYFYSMYSAGQHLNICGQSIQDVCDGITKSALSKKDNCWYKFEYIKDDLPVNYIKSANKRPRKKTDQQIKERIRDYQTRDWKCPNCDKVFRNYSKYDHRKRCN